MAGLYRAVANSSRILGGAGWDVVRCVAFDFAQAERGLASSPVFHPPFSLSEVEGQGPKPSQIPTEIHHPLGFDEPQRAVHRMRVGIGQFGV